MYGEKSEPPEGISRKTNSNRGDREIMETSKKREPPKAKLRTQRR